MKLQIMKMFPLANMKFMLSEFTELICTHTFVVVNTFCLIYWTPF